MAEPAADARDSGTDDPAAAAAPADRGSADLSTDVSWFRLRVVWRLVVVVARFLPLLVTYARDKRRFLLFGSGRSVTADQQVERAERLLDTLVTLGPTFIKVGQILSTRPDALPGPYIAVLQRLQDRVPPADWERVRPVVEAELGPVEEAFEAFDTTPISGASLGQVYTARVDGERVAVKVLRPNIRARVAADLRVIEGLTPLLIRGAEPGQAFTLENLADEFAATIRQEMDYRHEARALAAIRENFADDPGVRIPRVVDSHSGDRVLTMEYVDGTKITDVETLRVNGLDPEAVVERLENAYIEMILEDGLFHADPHPGNLAVQDDGTIVFYDFGITGRVSRRRREQITDMYVAIARDDVAALIDTFIEMGALDPTADRRVLRDLFEVILTTLRGQDVEQYRVQQLLADVQTELYEFPLRLPQDFALIVRVTTVLEGVARTLDPDFDVIALITDYVEREGYAQPEGQEVLDRAREELGALVGALLASGPALERTLDRALRDDLTVRTELTDSEGLADALARQVVLGLAFVGSVFAALVFVVGGEPTAAGVAAAGAGLCIVGLWRSLRRRSGVQAQPQFTRQNLRERREADHGSEPTGSGTELRSYGPDSGAGDPSDSPP